MDLQLLSMSVTKNVSRLSEQDKQIFIKYGQWLNTIYGYSEYGRGQRFPSALIAKILSQVRWMKQRLGNICP